jgi:O-antigen/teichoic acid export membrane protein/DNA-binding CsgD family transcriptional regulator
MNQLTEREQEVAADDVQDPQIAQRLGIAPGSAKLHLRNIHERLGAWSRRVILSLAPARSSRVSLKSRALNAGIWSLAGYGVSQIIRLGGALVMARWLTPEMFGVMEIAIVIMLGVAMFSDLGLVQNIIQSRRGEDPSFLNTAWTMQILRGALLSLIVVAIALVLDIARGAGLVPVSSVYADPALPFVIAALAFSPVISGFATTKVAQASRNLILGRLMCIDLVAQVAGKGVRFAWAFVDRSIWALVAALLTYALVSVVLGHAWLPGSSNRWQWEKSALKELVHFGKWMFVSSILYFVVTNGDRLLLGGLIDAATLGTYTIAVSVVSAISSLIAQLIARVGLPALSEVHRQGRDLRQVYYRIHAVIAGTAYFSAGFLVVSSRALIAILYDVRYTGAGWMLQIIALGLLAAPLDLGVQSCLALGKPQLLSLAVVIRLIALFVLAPLGFSVFGLPGFLGGFVISQLSILPAIVTFNRRHGLLDVKREALLLPVIIVGAAAGKLFTLAVG